MRRTAFAALTLSALLLPAAALLAGKPGGQDSRHGTISSIDQRRGQPPVATVTLEADFQGRPGDTVYGAESMTVRPGMIVRLDVVLGTAVFSLPVGTVLEVAPDGKSCLVSVDEPRLNATMEDPTSRTTVKLKDYFLVGAGVSISR